MPHKAQPAASPTPWRVERVKMKDGYHRLSILDANGLAIANLVMGLSDNEMANAHAIVNAVNESGASKQIKLIE